MNSQEKLRSKGSQKRSLSPRRKKGEGASSNASKISEHMLKPDEVARQLSTIIDIENPASSIGLTAEEAARRLEVDGPNMMTPPKAKSPVLLFVECLFSLFNVLLIVASVLTFVLYGLDPIVNSTSIYVGSILLGVTILNSIIEFIQLLKSERVLRSFLNLVPSKCNVVRGGKMMTIPAAELTKGDVVLLRMGDKSPADIYIFKCSDMKVDNSSLTGEAEPQERFVSNTHKNPLEATNLAFNSSMVVSGEAYGMVIRTGDNTVIGQIAGMTQGEKKRPSPMINEISSFVKKVGVISIISAIVFFVVSLLDNPDNPGFALNFGIGILLAWVPQGLPATVTMLLTFAAKRMSGQNVLVKDLYGVETLGAITMLATDKTGTLTRNQMTVAFYWTQSFFYSTARMADDRATDELAFESTAPGVSDILCISALCSRARFDSMEKPLLEREVFGDATESGLFRLAVQELPEFDELASLYPKVFEIPFNSENKWHMSIHKRKHATGTLVAYIKGAPERVLQICTHIMCPSASFDSPRATVATDPLVSIEEISTLHKENFSRSYERLAGKGHRVLAFAKFELPDSLFPENFVFSKETKNYPAAGFTFVGLASLEDPPKHGVREAVGHCRRAGIKVVMVTGDHPLTAEAIGRKINLMIMNTKETMARNAGVPENTIAEEEVGAIVIHGEKIDSLTEDDWDLIFSKEEIIFARTSPKHKLQIVKRAQALGHIVGVTGDGVNDSPALKKADLGIAMNISGSDVSKEAASMILLDDNFASIINGIREGRLIFANLKKAIKYVLTHITPEVIPQILYVLADFPLSLGALQILFIDLGFELLAAMSFAFELPENEGLMKLPPRRPVTGESIMMLREKAAFDKQFLSCCAANCRSKKGRPCCESRVEEGTAENTGDKSKYSSSSSKSAASAASEDGVVKLSLIQKMRMLMTAEYWKRFAFAESIRGEVLVDNNLLSYSFLEVGVIEFVGCQILFFIVLCNESAMSFSAVINCQKAGGFDAAVLPGKCVDKSGKDVGYKDLAEYQRRAQSAYYLTVMIMQIFNLLACKCLMSYPFSLYIFRNRVTALSVLGGIVFGVLFVYLPFLNEAVNTSYELPPIYLLISVGFGLVPFFYSSLRFFVISMFRPINYVTEPVGLQLHPTRWSTNEKR